MMSFRNVAWLCTGAIVWILGCAGDPVAEGPEPGSMRTIQIPGASSYPDGVAIASSGRMFIGSLSSGDIWTVADPPAGEVEVFASGQLERGALGMAVDEEHSVLLVCDASPLEPTSSALVVLDLEAGRRLAEHPLIPAVDTSPVLCNDVVVSADGDAFVTDTFGARVLRLSSADVMTDGVELQTWYEDELLAPDGEPAFGANGIAFLDGEVHVANFNRGSIVRITRDSAGTATGAVTLSLFTEAGAPTRLVGPDGIAPTRAGELLVVESGIFTPGQGNRLSLVSLDGDRGTVVPLLEGLDIPTTTVEGPAYTWVVEGQLDHLIELDPAPPGPFTVTGVAR